MDLMTFQTINYNVRTSQTLDIRLVTTSKNNFGEIHISWPTPKVSLSVPLWLLLKLNNDSIIAGNRR